MNEDTDIDHNKETDFEFKQDREDVEYNLDEFGTADKKNSNTHRSRSQTNEQMNKELDELMRDEIMNDDDDNFDEDIRQQTEWPSNEQKEKENCDEQHPLQIKQEWNEDIDVQANEVYQDENDDFDLNVSIERTECELITKIEPMPLPSELRIE